MRGVPLLSAYVTECRRDFVEKGEKREIKRERV